MRPKPFLALLQDVRALLLLGYAGAFRRSELVALDVEDLRFSAKGLFVWIAAAKNDPRKKGRELYVYYPNGMARPKIPMARIEKLLETSSTGRNWNTVNKLLAMAEKLEG